MSFIEFSVIVASYGCHYFFHHTWLSLRRHFAMPFRCHIIADISMILRFHLAELSRYFFAAFIRENIAAFISSRHATLRLLFDIARCHDIFIIATDALMLAG
jgi:hypothetical protein